MQTHTHTQTHTLLKSMQTHTHTHTHTRTHMQSNTKTEPVFFNRTVCGGKTKCFVTWKFCLKPFVGAEWWWIYVYIRIYRIFIAYICTNTLTHCNVMFCYYGEQISTPRHAILTFSSLFLSPSKQLLGYPLIYATVASLFIPSNLGFRSYPVIWRRVWWAAESVL